jgi:hypothetical protein
MISPTVGRIVWYRPAHDDVRGAIEGDICAAIICDVRLTEDSVVDLCVFGPDGTPYPRPAVRLVQPGVRPGYAGGYCEWMPYQVGQAEKTKELQAQIKGA